MTIDEKTAQLILDAIAWEMQENEDITDPTLLTILARMDFIRFCNDRGIETVERKVIL